MKEIIKKALSRVGLRDAFTHRSRLAGKYLSGTGLEIGAMNRPLRAPSRAKVKYVDIATREESIRKFPELNPRDIVEVDYIADGFTLEGVPESGFDFLVANHVLEHSHDPVGTLVRWHGVLRDSGILYCSVPIAEMCFDKGRPITPFTHMLEDYLAGISRDPAVARELNLQHYLEWLTISLPAITGKPPPSNEELHQQAADLALRRTEIHFHAFSPQSVRELFEGVHREVLPGLQILEVSDSGGEVIVIARKTPVL
jgi:SAM-dependent methyltransferase